MPVALLLDSGFRRNDDVLAATELVQSPLSPSKGKSGEPRLDASAACTTRAGNTMNRPGGIAMRRIPRCLLRAAAVLLLICSTAAAWALATEIEKQLVDSQYVYIASTRKDGSLGKPAEIWFFYQDGAVYVGTSPKSWRVRRIRWGRPQAKIWVGKEDGPSFTARGEVIDDDAIEAKLLETYAKKYPERWNRYAESFRKGFESGERVVVKYTPLP